MESYRIEKLTFKYPGSKKNAVENVSLTVRQGEFITVCGKSGSGKSTLLTCLKPSLSPAGSMSGDVIFMGKPARELSLREQSREIGFVTQDPENQIVTDKVWHELSFGAESLGMTAEEMRVRVAETAAFFGIQNWFHKAVTELSGGQKQILSLASVMVTQPSALLLDEPSGSLDPIAAGRLIELLTRINREMGVTVIITEHEPSETFEASDRLVVMENGHIIVDASPCETARRLRELGHDMFRAMPAPIRAYAAIEEGGLYPVTVREGRRWLMDRADRKGLGQISRDRPMPGTETAALTLENVHFRYARGLPDVLKGFSMSVRKGEFYSIVGGNGAGKTTALNVIGGVCIPQRGKVTLDGRVGILPQDPRTILIRKTVMLDLMDMLEGSGLSREEKRAKTERVIRLCGLENLTNRHPYDLSGGERQRAAIAKLLMRRPDILLLDEPTRGIDAHFKRELAMILRRLVDCGCTVVMVSHDIEFCAEYSDRCAMFFDGGIVSEGEPREFFSEKSFYTTEANRMSRGIIENAVTVGDIIEACGGTAEKNNIEAEKDSVIYPPPESGEPEPVRRTALGMLFCAALTAALILSRLLEGKAAMAAQLAAVLSLGAAVSCFVRQKPLKTSPVRRENRKQSYAALLPMLAAVSLTIFVGIYCLNDRSYYTVSLLIILETIMPFIIMFEKRKPKVSEMVTVAVLCSIAAAGRAAFAVLPQFKPVAAVVIISGVCFGGNTGFLVGAVSAFVSNFFFGQGPWTPWQMLSFGLIGLFAGLLFERRVKTRGGLCVYGGAAAIIIYGGIMNPASLIMSGAPLNISSVFASYAAGLPFDIIHAASTSFFLWTAASPLIEKLERIKLKYGMTV